MGCKKAPSTGGYCNVTGIDPEYETKAVGEETPDWSCCRCCWAGETRSASVHNRTRKWRGEKGEKSKTGHDNRFANWHPSVQGSIGLTHSISLTQSVHISLPLSLSFCFSLLPSPETVQGSGFSPFLALAHSLSLLTSPHSQSFACCCWLSLLFCALIGQLKWWFRAGSDYLPLGILKHWGGAIY